MFPNVEIALRIFLSMMVTNCSGERSFSKLKRIKKYNATRKIEQFVIDVNRMLYAQKHGLQRSN